MTVPNATGTMPLQPEDCRTLGALRGAVWFLDHRGADSDEQASACAEIADDLQIPDRAGFAEGWSAGVRLLEHQPWLPCALCHREHPALLCHLVGEDYLCLFCFHEQEEVERLINEHEARHS